MEISKDDTTLNIDKKMRGKNQNDSFLSNTSQKLKMLPFTGKHHMYMYFQN